MVQLLKTGNQAALELHFEREGYSQLISWLSWVSHHHNPSSHVHGLLPGSLFAELSIQLSELHHHPSSLVHDLSGGSIPPATVTRQCPPSLLCNDKLGFQMSSSTLSYYYILVKPVSESVSESPKFEPRFKMMFDTVQTPSIVVVPYLTTIYQ